MARPLRLNVRDGVYHVTCRSTRAKLFRDDRDRWAYLDLLSGVRDAKRVEWLSYCLMGNHLHLLVRTPGGDLSEAMRAVSGPYAQGFNRRHSERGPMFAGRFGARLVQSGRYLAAVAAYIARNPVKDGFCRRPEDWPWSAHNAIIGGRAPGPAAVSEMLALLGADPTSARRSYMAAVTDPMKRDFEPKGAILGDRDFVRRFAPMLPPPPEVARDAWHQGRPALSDLAAGLDRDTLVVVARTAFGYEVKEIASALGCSTEVVRRRLRAAGT